jgi:hypothetical protein
VIAGAIITASLIVAGALWMAAREIAVEIRAAREEAARGRMLAILQTLAPGVGAAHADPRALLVWQPLARVARQAFPTETAALDRAAGGTFPFTPDQIQAAHARWTTEWLAWERLHDAEFKQKAAEVEQEITASGGSAAARARLDTVEREKLDLYQRHYQEYVQVAKALQALTR